MTNRPHRMRRPPPVYPGELEAELADVVLHRAILRLQLQGLPTTTIADALLAHVVELAARQPGRPAVRQRLATALRDVEALRARNLASQYEFFD